MRLGTFKQIGEPDLPPCWIHRNVRVKGHYGDPYNPYDFIIARPIEDVFQDACKKAREFPDDATIVEAWALDDYGSICFKFRYWGIPDR